MVKVNPQLRFGIAGLIISFAILIIANVVGSKFNAFAILSPLLVITFIGIYKQFKYVKK